MFISLGGILDLGLLVTEDILPALALRYLTPHRTCRRSQVHHWVWVWIHIAVCHVHRNGTDRVVGMVVVAIVGVADLRRQRVEVSEVVACHTARDEV